MTARLTKSDASEWPWPDSLDALSAAPEHHRLLLENDRVRVLETRIGPGERTPIHTHRWPSVLHVISASDFIRSDATGKVLVDTRHAGGLSPSSGALWSEALPPHALENVGVGEIRVISVELK